jgi:hypothetical protein
MSPPISPNLRQLLAKGTVIPAHPLALNANRRLDERRQRALTRYYIAAGAGGVAVGVHTTQFAIREPQIGLFNPVLTLAAEEMDRADRGRPVPLIRIGGICGDTPHSVRVDKHRNGDMARIQMLQHLPAGIDGHFMFTGSSAANNRDDHEGDYSRFGGNSRPAHASMLAISVSAFRPASGQSVGNLNGSYWIGFIRVYWRQARIKRATLAATIRKQQRQNRGHSIDFI